MTLGIRRALRAFASTGVLLLFGVGLAGAGHSVVAGAPSGTRTLGFDERVAAQRAIELVYWNHRVWPQENPAPKPALSTVLSDDAIRARVEDYLKKSNALATWWRPITPEQLQAELDRMSERTRDPEILRELYAALGNDPLLIAEVLARPTLVERRIRDRYAADDRFHGEVREAAQRALARVQSLAEMKALGGEYVERTFVRRADEGAGAPDRSDPGVVALDGAGWTDWTEDLARQFGKAVDAIPLERLSGLREDTDRFSVMAVLRFDTDRAVVAHVIWPKRSFDAWWSEERARTSAEIETLAGKYEVAAPSKLGCTDDTWERKFYVPEAHQYGTAVWTGTEMIVWGGIAGAFPSYSVFGTGGRYNPATDSWTPTSTGENAPSARAFHTAVWTGTEMIVWGGSNRFERFETGGRYNPTTDSWTATAAWPSAPSARVVHTAVWTGTEMIVWGGGDDDGPLDTGGRYDPTTDTWTPTSVGANAPSARHDHTAVWTGAEMIVWGGVGSGNTNTGGRYDPTTDSWTAMSTGVNVPAARALHTAVWTGAEMVVWGGADNTQFATGGRYDPTTDSWAETSTGANVPSARAYHTAAWTGTEMIVWGGLTDSSGFLSTGARYDPVTDAWAATSTSMDVPQARAFHVVVWTGTEMIVWGGHNNTGGRYDPTTDTWTATSVGTNVPLARLDHTAVWTGAEMIVWGGGDTFGASFDTGARYNPTTDSWVPTSTGPNAPSARSDHTAVWTGAEMIVWGGGNTGGRYNPMTDGWTATSTGANVPSARSDHTTVWTGTEMIVWGGRQGSNYLSTGARYDPATDTWAATSTSLNVPSVRAFHTAVWTGVEMIVWGGQAAASGLNTGGRYDPTTDSWTATSTSANVPSGRPAHTAVWTGTQMIVWGGDVNTGGRYHPPTDSWTATSTGANTPTGRFGHTAVWTGAEMIVWGGEQSSTFLNTGGRYAPTTDGWTTTSTGANTPARRYGHTAVWTGAEMMVWGGEPPDSNLGLYCASSCPAPVTSYRDADLDGFGDAGDSTTTCDGSIPPGYAADGGDCNDGDAAVHPGAAELCNGNDEDCDGAADETFDLDLDTYTSCDLPAADCDDGDATVYPGASEVSDGQDNQCPGDAGYGISDEIAGAIVYGPNGELCWSDSSGATLYQVARSANPDFDPAVIIATVSAAESCVTDTTPLPVGGVWYYLVRAIAPHVGSWGQDSSGVERVVSFESNGVVDQANLVSTGNVVVSLSQQVGQTFTVGLAGQLVGIEIAPLADNLEPADVLLLDVWVDGAQSGTAMITASGFPPGAGTVPAPLSLDETGPGYFDLAPLGITVEVGQTVEFALRPGWESAAKRCRAGTNSNGYGAGSGTVNGSSGFNFDLGFKTLVRSY